MSLQHGKLMTKGLLKAYGGIKIYCSVSYNVGTGYMKCPQCVAVEESAQHVIRLRNTAT